ncbi:MAG: hypothetical protein M3Z00_05775 [Actinomycetota bacterium]|nr:hypothetical protein [Actinomycetota bacterium]
MMAVLPTIPLPAGWLADPPQPPPSQGPEWGKAAPIGALVLIMLGIAVWLLMRNMSKHLRKVQEMADAESGAAARDAPNDGAVDVAVDGEKAHRGEADIA